MGRLWTCPWSGQLFADRRIPTTSPPAVDTWCRDEPGAGIARYRFFDSSSGSVHGVVLTDGRAVVVKGHRPDADVAYLRATLCAAAGGSPAKGSPAPQPLARSDAHREPGTSPPRKLLVQCRPDGRRTPPRSVRRSRPVSPGSSSLALARARHVARSSAIRCTGSSTACTRPPLAPVRFRRDADRRRVDRRPDSTPRGACDASPTMPPGVEVVAHGDWRVQNVSLRDGGARRRLRLGQRRGRWRRWARWRAAALTFRVDWQRTATSFPLPAEIVAFVSEYGRRTGSR